MSVPIILTWRGQTDFALDLANYAETLMAQGHASNGWRYAVAEHHLYGSSRIGLHQTQLQLRERKPDLTIVYASVSTHVAFYAGKRNYELSNHPGNFNGCWFCKARPYSHESRERSDSGVKATISDKRRSVCNEELGIAYFEAEVLTQTDYYPFGAVMPDRQWSAGAEGYGYGFNDDEPYGKGNALYFGARIYDSRLGRWLSLDPLWRKYSSYSPYNFVINNPIVFFDYDGRELVIAIDDSEKRNVVFKDLQMLSSKKLVLLKNGTVMEAHNLPPEKASEIGFEGAVSGGRKPYGTKLLSDVIESEHKNTIILATEGNNETIPLNREDATPEGMRSIEGIAGTGKGSGTIVKFDPNYDGVKTEKNGAG